MIRTRFHDWLFADRTKHKIPFLNWSFKVNDLWRKAHAFPDCKEMSGVVLRIITCGASEADAERVISLQRSRAGVNATHYGIDSMKARLRGRLSVINGKQICMKQQGFVDEQQERFEAAEDADDSDADD
jgi:hypothetical protein